MWCLTIITYFAFSIQILFLTVAIAAGLYYLAELVEEYTVVTKKIIWWMNLVTIIIYVMLWLFENFPTFIVICGILAQLSHFLILVDFPYIIFLSPSFLISVLFIIINHYLAFQHFASIFYSFSEVRFKSTMFSDIIILCFKVMAYFTLCLWLVPFALFISLSANENVLPTVVERSRDDIVSDQLKITVYYEALCPDSVRFITKQLYPTYSKIGKFLNIDFVPYGKASQRKENNTWTFECQHGPKECQADKQQACALQLSSDDQCQSVGFIYCVLNDYEPDDEEVVQKRYLSAFSLQTVLVGCLQMLGGGFASWLYLSLVEDSHQIVYSVEDEKISIREFSFFLIVNGLWIGSYHFIQVGMCDRILAFPVIYQGKFNHFKSQFRSIFNYSKHFSVFPTISFIAFYKIFGYHLCQSFTAILNVPVTFHDFHLVHYCVAWIFSTSYIININVTQFCFKLFLTQPIQYAVTESFANEASLQEGLSLEEVPIIQHLASLDFYLMSIWSPERRQMLFTLSQPGGHPHTWNSVISTILKMLNKFQEPLIKLLDGAAFSEESIRNINDIPSIEMISSQSYFNVDEKYSNMRHMSLNSELEAPQIIEVERRSLILTELPNRFKDVIIQMINNLINYIKSLPSYKYLFDNLPEIQILECFLNGQTIVWIVQGLANVIVKSFNEDPYGVIQKDFSVVLTNLVKLKLTLEKLNKIMPHNKKTGDDFSRKMRNNINNATRRALIDICRTFKDYLDDIPLEKNIRTE
ncbi:hypothetical protein FQR65_LT05628 [Abscondita terminalis]|nr:hypothetical protein FQR65_LT05628 [Abscondita terminalis]